MKTITLRELLEKVGLNFHLNPNLLSMEFVEITPLNYTETKEDLVIHFKDTDYKIKFDWNNNDEFLQLYDDTVGSYCSYTRDGDLYCQA